MLRKAFRYIPLLLVFLIATDTRAELELDPAFSARVLGLAEMLNNSAYQEVLAQGPVLLEEITLAHPDGSVDEAKVLDFLVNAAYRSRAVMDPQNLIRGERAIELKEQLLGNDSPELANTLLHVGNLYTRRYEGELAVPHYERAVRILDKAGPDHDRRRAIILNSLGAAQRQAGRDGKALELYGQALAIQERLFGPEHPDLAATLNNQGSALSRLGDCSAAADIHRRAMTIRENHFGVDHEWVGESAYNLSNELATLGRFDEALALQERVVEIWAAKLGTDHQRFWLARMNLGITYQEMGDPAEAVPILEDVIEGLTKRFGENNPTLSYALDALGTCRYDQGRPDDALAIYETSLKITEANYGVGTYESADTVSLIGKSLIALDRLDEALVKLKASLEIWRLDLAEDNAILCPHLNSLAELHLQRQDAAAALETATYSQQLCRRDLGEEHPLHAGATLLAGRAQFALGQNELALESALIAEGVSQRHLRQTMPVLSENRALHYAASRIDGVDLAVAALNAGESGDRVAAVWDAVIKARSGVLDQYVARNRVLNLAEDPDSKAMMDSSLAVRDRLANLTLRGPGWEELSMYKQMLVDAEQQLERIERGLSLHSVRFRQEQSAPDIGYAEVRAALPEGAALAAFVRTVDHQDRASYQVFVQAAEHSPPAVIELGDAGKIDEAVADWRRQITFGVQPVAAPNRGDDAAKQNRGFQRISADADEQLAAYRNAGTELRHLIWDPLAQHLSGATSVFLVADASLHLVNFSALPVGDDGYLLEEALLINNLTAEKYLALEAPRREAGGLLLAVGGATYDLADGEQLASGTRGDSAHDETRQPMRFADLPQTELEAQLVQNIWHEAGLPTELLTGAQANETRLKRSLPGARVVHLATHGFFQPAIDRTGAANQWHNPMIGSGLALSGANGWQQAIDGGDDGILTAQEASALDLSDVQWAVLSACDTGLGVIQARGEGVFGLRRAFALAGAETIIMSLWAVDDEATRQWMTDLYGARWRDGQSTAAALKSASLKALTRRREAGLSVHPYYWAAFVATGQWR